MKKLSVSDNINISTLWISIYFIHSLYYINTQIQPTDCIEKHTHCIKYIKLFVLFVWLEPKKNRHPISDYHYSELTILRTNRENSGNYSCVASNAQPAFVLVHIFKGKYYIDIYTKCSNTTQWIELNRIKCGIRVRARTDTHTHAHIRTYKFSWFRSFVLMKFKWYYRHIYLWFVLPSFCLIFAKSERFSRICIMCR